jgi:hypothetical protein
LATAGIQNDPAVSQFDVTGIRRLDHFPAKDSHLEVLRFFLIPHGKEVRSEKTFVRNRCIGQIHAVPLVFDKSTIGWTRNRLGFKESDSFTPHQDALQ